MSKGHDLLGAPLPTADDMDHTPLDRGKYRGRTPDQISQIDPGYIVWLYETVKPLKCSEVLYRDCRDETRNSDCKSIGHLNLWDDPNA